MRHQASRVFANVSRGGRTGWRRGAADAGFSRVSTQQKKVLLFRSTPVKHPVVYYQKISTHENECLKYSKVKSEN